ncbi:hypothetical protein [Paenibacillus taiwanensis]|nr:hypothetical protein [Paenibacillus taiwanensis]
MKKAVNFYDKKSNDELISERAEKRINWKSKPDKWQCIRFL